jgi:hypothetical protein
MSEVVEAAVTVAVNPHLRVLILDDETDSLPRTLGITEEREKELDELTKTAYKDHKTFTDSFVDISKNVRHANEFAYCIFHMGSFCGRGRALSELGDLSKLLDLAGRSKSSDDSEDSED